jgi:predicted helicase
MLINSVQRRAVDTYYEELAAYQDKNVMHEIVVRSTFQYRLGNRSALKWVIDQYRVTTDARSSITSDLNREDDEQYIVRLVGKVITVSIETITLINELAGAVRQEDWLSE